MRRILRMVCDHVAGVQPAACGVRVVVLILACLFASPAVAQDDDDFLPGLHAKYTAGGKTVSRIDDDLSFDWGTAAPDVRLGQPRPFTAEWTAKLLVRKSERYTFHAFVAGEVTLKLDGKTILAGKTNSATWISGQPVPLRFGQRRLRVRFRTTGKTARIHVFWSSESFPLEPLPAHLLFREKPLRDLKAVETGRVLYDVHRCNRCHQRKNEPSSLPGPDLTHVGSGLSRENLITKIQNPSQNSPQAKMPTFGFDKDDASAIAAFLQSVSKPVKLKPLPKKRRSRRRSKTKPVSERRAGELLVRSVGCLACHTVGKHGNNGPYSGGDLSNIGRKRSVKWISQWLLDPKTLNADHRMPVFKLTATERRKIAVYLASLKNDQSKTSIQRAAPVRKRAPAKDVDGDTRSLTVAARDPKMIARGRKLVEQSRCAACHTIPTVKSPPSLPKDLSLRTNTPKNSCLAKTPNPQKHRPAYPHIDTASVTAYLQSHAGKLSPPSRFELGRRVLERRNCLACHERNQSRGIVETAGRMSKLDDALRGQSQALIPPSLNAVGDKLLDDYLKTAIAGEQKTVRLPWLRVRMPRFEHSKDDSVALVSYLKSHDRIPGGLDVRAKPQAKLPGDSQILVAGQTLLGVRGFSCIACHKVGDYEPRNTAPGTRGSDLMHMAGRMRRSFFDRWTRHPIRIVPGMEMPSYHNKPVPGVLNDDVDLQLAVLWKALNDKRFKPPTNPSVVEQFVTVKPGEPARIIRDVFTVPEENGGGYVARSLAIGLNNGHNLLFDLDTYSLRGWFFGDFARQRTQGKSWYWDMAGVPVMTGLKPGPDIILVKKDKKTGKETVHLPKRVNGSVGRLIAYSRDTAHFGNKGLRWQYALRFTIGEKDVELEFTDIVLPVDAFPKTKQTGVIRIIMAGGITPTTGNAKPRPIPDGFTVYVARPIPDSRIGNPRIEDQSDDLKTIKATEWRRVESCPNREYAALNTEEPLGPGKPSGRSIVLGYRSHLVRERSKISLKPKVFTLHTEEITSVPGFRGTRLPLSRSIMPTALTWTRRSRSVDRQLALTSLKGQVFIARDTNKDGIEDSLKVFDEGLAAPYGIIPIATKRTKPDPFEAQLRGLLVCHKSGLLMYRGGEDHRANELTVLATGWGYTDNYHDWTCGIVRDKQGNLYVGLGSDYAQPKRPKEHSRWRGKVLRISPKGKITPVGHSFRYPTGLAMNHEGEIFVSDNQGVQNTFNEINHLQPGKHYGVPSRYEKNRDAPTTPPAIQIPHPWTRSVNGIFFLPTASPERQRRERPGKRSTPVADAPGSPRKTHFVEAFAGHGIGCEYDNRFLIRFTLQKVDGVYQGACYAFSKPNAGIGKTNFLGPLCGGVAPDGAIYIGSIYDSGWLGGPNTGDIVRLVPNGKLPNGIRELRVSKEGFEIEFIRSVDREEASKAGAYSIVGYNRIWKGSYSTPDSNRHKLPVKAVAVSKDNKTVRLTVPNRRSGGYLYEVRVGKIGTKSQRELWPATGYYTLHRIPN